MTAGNAMIHPLKIVQTPALVVLLYEQVRPCAARTVIRSV